VRPAEVLRGIEAFCQLSRQRAYQSWVDKHEWGGEFDGGDAGDEFQEWVELFTDLMKDALALTVSGRHKEAATAYRQLLDLLKEARENTDILGNHGAPEDVLPIDFSEVIGAYTRSLMASRSRRRLDDVFDEILPVARKFWYARGFAGLVGALDADSRVRLKARVSRMVAVNVKSDRRGCPEEVEGLIALAEVERNQPEALALKERFASRNTQYLDDVLAHYKRAQDWASAARLAEMGVRSFGHHGEYAKALVKAREALGDPLAAQDAEIAHFLDEPGAAAFAAPRRKSQALSNWGTVFERLVQASASRGSGDPPIRLRMLVLLAEGQETEALAGVERWRAPRTLTRSNSWPNMPLPGCRTAPISSVQEARGATAEGEAGQRGIVHLAASRAAKAGTRSRGENGRLAVDMYRRLMGFHLNSGNSWDTSGSIMGRSGSSGIVSGPRGAGWRSRRPGRAMIAQP
jgi:tetratricopeptide (TPR) repeat protein